MSLADMKQADEEDWSEVMREFQTVETPSADLVKAVEKGRRKLAFGMVAGTLSTAVTSTVGISVFLRDRDLPGLLFAGMQVGVPVSIMAFVWMSQRRAWKPTTHTTRAFLELELERRRSLLRQGKFTRSRMIPITVLLVVVWHLMLFIEHPPLLHPNSLLLAAIGFGGPYLILGAVFWRTGRARKKLEREAESLAAKILELGEPDETRAVLL